MLKISKTLSRTFKNFVRAEQVSGLLLLACVVFSLVVSNSALGTGYLRFWHTPLGFLTLEQWINDALMAVFFLLIGLELERELYVGELADLKNALLPILAAIGGMLVPALLHFSLNGGSATQSGFGIPMATDIAFALGVLALLGKRVPAALKVFVVAFAVIDDLGAILVIASFYTAKLALPYLLAALGVWALLLVLNRFLRVQSLALYLLGGALLWGLMLKSGLHATIAGVMLAFAVPFSAQDDEKSPSHKLEHGLHKPVAFFILPLFALANTGVVLDAHWAQSLLDANSLGILAGLVLGKPLGVVLFCWAACATGLCRLPESLTWSHIIGAGLLGGIGFTMSIFITNLAFADAAPALNASKIAILLASLLAGLLGFLWLKFLVGGEKTHE